VSDAVVIGAGPAGLMAAEELARAGRQVEVIDRMPSVGRKFLMAGKSGLNLTKAEAHARFIAAYGAAPPALRAALDAFGPEAVQEWARGLGQDLFTGTTGRVFPVAMKASPLLRAWLRRLEELGVSLTTRARWTGWEEDGALRLEGTGPRRARVTVLALGGGSWARLGSDGLWTAALPEGVLPFAPSNAGLMVDWSGHMAKHLGQPVKGVALRAGAQVSRGEWVVSAQGIEGGGVYALSPALRAGAPLRLDLAPDLTAEEVAARLARPRGKASLSNHLRKALKLDPVKIALLNEWGRPLPDDLAPLIKDLPVRHGGFRPLDEAISTVGGLRADALDADLMLRARPGVFCAGEMLDWDAPTGGYLISACLATGRHAGRAAARWAQPS